MNWKRASFACKLLIGANLFFLGISLTLILAIASELNTAGLAIASFFLIAFILFQIVGWVGDDAWVKLLKIELMELYGILIFTALSAVMGILLWLLSRWVQQG
jgi:pilus assembly protein TadC